MIYPYLIFQTLYLLFSNQILDKDADMQYTTPYWLLWYLFAIIVWNLVLPLVQVEGMKKKMAMLLAAAAASVFIGFDEKAGYFLSASRIDPPSYVKLVLFTLLSLLMFLAGFLM